MGSKKPKANVGLAFEDPEEAVHWHTAMQGCLSNLRLKNRTLSAEPAGATLLVLPQHAESLCVLSQGFCT